MLAKEEKRRHLREAIRQDSNQIDNVLNRELCAIASRASQDFQSEVSSSECLYHLASKKGEELMDPRGLAIREYIIDHINFDVLSTYMNEYWYDPELSRIVRYLIMKLFVMPELSNGKQRNRFQAYFKFNRVLGEGLLGKVYSISTFSGLSLPLTVKIFKDYDEFQNKLEALAFLTVGNAMAKKCLNFTQSYAQFSCSNYEDLANTKQYICAPEGEEQDLHLLMTELNGVTLKAFLKKRDLYSENDVASIILQIYLALKIARRDHGFVHGDLHTENIIIVGLPDYKYLKYKSSDFYAEDKTSVLYVRARFQAVMMDFGLSRFKYVNPKTKVEHYFDGKAHDEYLIKTKADDEIEDMWKFLNWLVQKYSSSRVDLLFFNLFFPEQYRDLQGKNAVTNAHAPPFFLKGQLENGKRILSDPLLFVKMMDLLFSMREKRSFVLEPQDNDAKVEYENGYAVLAPRQEKDLATFFKELFSRDPLESEQELASMNLHDLNKRFVYLREERFFKHLLAKQKDFEAEVEVYLELYPIAGFNAYAYTKIGWYVLYYRYLELKQLYDFFKERGVQSMAMSRFSERVKVNEIFLPQEKKKFLSKKV